MILHLYDHSMESILQSANHANLVPSMRYSYLVVVTQLSGSILESIPLETREVLCTKFPYAELKTIWWVCIVARRRSGSGGMEGAMVGLPISDAMRSTDLQPTRYRGGHNHSMGHAKRVAKWCFPLNNIFMLLNLVGNS